jgi:DNA polymerase-3 subunit chi
LLWTYRADSFLPHARSGVGDDTVQPILIAPDVQAANAARYIALVDGEWREAALDFDRAFHFFEDSHIQPARQAWRDLNGRAGVERRYWKQSDAGRWEQAA